MYTVCTLPAFLAMTYLFQNTALGQLTERASQYSLGDLSTSEVAIVSHYNIKYSCKSTLMFIPVHCQDDKEEEIPKQEELYEVSSNL